MKVLDTIRVKVGGFIGGLAYRESVENSIPIVDDFGDVDDRFFRTLQSKSQRNLTNRRRERVLKIVYWLYLAYPIAKRGIEVKRDFIMGDGFTVEAVDDAVQKVIDDFINDPDNELEDRFDTWMLELSLYGELFLQTFVNSVSGKVKLGFIDPLDVRRIITDPENVLMPRAIKTARHDASGEAHVLKVINVDNRVDSETHEKLVGDVFVFTINKASNAQRGNSDLFPCVDWIEAHEQFLFGIHEGNEMRNSLVWDVKAEGASEKQLKDLKKEFGRIKKGMVRIHNEKVTVTAIVPNMASSDQSIHASLLKHHIAAALGVPVEWLSERAKSNVNNSSVTAGVPATKSLRHRQKKAVRIYKKMMNYVIDKAQEHGALKEDVNRSFVVKAPHIYAVDIQRIAQSLLATAQALMIGVQNEFTDTATSREIFSHLIGQFGIDLNNIETDLVHEEVIDEAGEMRVGHMNALMTLVDKLEAGGLTRGQAKSILKVAFPKGRDALFEKLLDEFFKEEMIPVEKVEKTEGIASGATGKPPQA